MDEGVIHVLFVAGLASVPDRLSNGSDVQRGESYTGPFQKKKTNFCASNRGKIGIVVMEK